MKYLVAVSGGIDSIVLLDMLARSEQYQLTVAHFDHGIRQDSAADARFVKGLAKQYGVEFIEKREELGVATSEDKARKRRYAFLREAARQRGAVVVTAHHQDDIVESIAINLARGTGWRGLAVFGSEDIKRPLLRFSKADIRTYARANKLEWVEDSTNAEDTYLRNRLRRHIKRQLDDSDKEQLVRLWKRQNEIKDDIEAELSRLLKSIEGSRYFLSMIDQTTAIEILRFAVLRAVGATLTRPQAERALLAIKTARAGSMYEAGSGITLRFTVDSFIALGP